MNPNVEKCAFYEDKILLPIFANPGPPRNQLL